MNNRIVIVPVVEKCSFCETEIAEVFFVGCTGAIMCDNCLPIICEEMGLNKQRSRVEEIINNALR